MHDDAISIRHLAFLGELGPPNRFPTGALIRARKDSEFSFFARENANWIIVGLDSAYNANVLKLYMDGSLGANSQFPFLQGLAKKGKEVIVLTHHNGLPENGAGILGHMHVGAAHKPLNGRPLPAPWPPRRRRKLGLCINGGADPLVRTGRPRPALGTRYFAKTKTN
jgi:hypothetical protein